MGQTRQNFWYYIFAMCVVIEEQCAFLDIFNLEYFSFCCVTQGLQFLIFHGLNVEHSSALQNGCWV